MTSTERSSSGMSEQVLRAVATVADARPRATGGRSSRPRLIRGGVMFPPTPGRLAEALLVHDPVSTTSSGAAWLATAGRAAQIEQQLAEGHAFAAQVALFRVARNLLDELTAVESTQERDRRGIARSESRRNTAGPAAVPARDVARTRKVET
jgi:hypothetical protein